VRACFAEASQVGAGVFCSIILFAGPGLAQQQQRGTGGIASGVNAAPVYDEQKRPITAGGFVDSGPIIFWDITKQPGLAGWRHKMGVSEKNFIVETNGGILQRQDVLASGSYISANARRLHFGLGDATDADCLEIHWPSGKKETIKLPAVDRIHTITEGQGIMGALCGGNPCEVVAGK